MWRYLLLCIIRFTGDYTLYPQRLAFPAFSDEGSSGLGAKKYTSSSSEPPSVTHPHPSHLLRRLPPPSRFSGYMSVLAFAINYSNSFWNAGLHFEWLVQRQECFLPLPFFFRSWQVSSAIRLKNRPIVRVDLVAQCDEGLRQTGVFKSGNWN